MFSVAKMSGEVVLEDHIDNFTTAGSIEIQLEHNMGMPVRLMNGNSILGKRKRVADTIEDGVIVCVILQPDTPHAVTSQGAFAVVRVDGSVVTWGDDLNGGDSTSVAGKLTGGVKNCTQMTKPSRP